MQEKLTVNLGNGFGLQLPDNIILENIKLVDIEYSYKEGICEHRNQMRFIADPKENR